MRRKTPFMTILTVIAIALYATRFVPSLAIPLDLSDFFGGVAVGLAIGTLFTWIAERA